MSRLIRTGEDLSGQIIEGQPFSYVGRCTGMDIKFTGDRLLAASRCALALAIAQARHWRLGG